MIRFAKSQAAAPRMHKAQNQPSRNIRHRLRDTRAALAVNEGNTDGDWQPWEDSMVAFESQFQSMKDQFAHGDAFASVYQER